MGFKHTLNSDDFEFMIQKKATLLCPTLEEMMRQGQSLAAQQLIDRLLQVVMSEYQRGYADNDHALMQNTGVLQGEPIHIDVGQFAAMTASKIPRSTVRNYLIKHGSFASGWKSVILNWNNMS